MLTFKQFIQLVENSQSKQKIPTALIIHDKGYSTKPPKFFGSFRESDSSDIDEKEKILQDKVDYNDRDLINSLNNYTGKFGSRQLNCHLMECHHLGLDPGHTFELEFGNVNLHALDKAAKTPLGVNLDAYSGVAFDPRRHTNDSGLIHFPAYTSTSLEKGRALDYSKNFDETKHIIHFHLNGNDTGVYANHKKNIEENQRELILPRGTTVRITHSHMDPDNPGTMIHHAEIIHGVNPVDIEKTPARLFFLAPHNRFSTNQGMRLQCFPSSSVVEDIKNLVRSGKCDYSELHNIKHHLIKPDYDDELDNLIENAKKKIIDEDSTIGLTHSDSYYKRLEQRSRSADIFNNTNYW